MSDFFTEQQLTETFNTLKGNKHLFGGFFRSYSITA